MTIIVIVHQARDSVQINFSSLHTKFPNQGRTNAILTLANEHYAANSRGVNAQLRTLSCLSDQNRGYNFGLIDTVKTSKLNSDQGEFSFKLAGFIWQNKSMIDWSVMSDDLCTVLQYPSGGDLKIKKFQHCPGFFLYC